MSSRSDSAAPQEGHDDAVHIAGAVSVSAAGGELELLTAYDGAIVLSAGVEATGPPPSALRCVRIANHGSVSLAAVRQTDGGEEQLSLESGVTTITLGSVRDAAAAMHLQIGPIRHDALAADCAPAADVLSVFISAERAIESSAEVWFLGQAINYRGS